MSDDIFQLELKGIVRDANEKFQIRYDISDGGTPFLIGARLWATKELENGKEIDRNIDLKAFGDVANELAHIQDGDYIHVKGELGLQKSKNSDRYFNVCFIDEVIDA